MLDIYRVLFSSFPILLSVAILFRRHLTAFRRKSNVACTANENKLHEKFSSKKQINCIDNPEMEAQSSYYVLQSVLVYIATIFDQNVIMTQFIPWKITTITCLLRFMTIN